MHSKQVQLFTLVDKPGSSNNRSNYRYLWWAYLLSGFKIYLITLDLALSIIKDEEFYR